MTDLQDIRSRLRDDVRRGSPSEEGGNSGKYTIAIVAGGLVIGFALYIFVPRFFQSTSTAVMRDISVGKVDVRITDGGRYTGKSPEDAATLADEVCAVRTSGRQPGKPPRLGEAGPDFLVPDGIKRIHEQMHCMLTEGPMRFCSPAQRKMIVNEITLYFRGIENANRAFGVIRGNEAKKSISDDVNPDSRVLVALETRIRDGQLTPANRDVLAGEAPRWVRRPAGQGRTTAAIAVSREALVGLLEIKRPVVRRRTSVPAHQRIGRSSDLTI